MRPELAHRVRLVLAVLAFLAALGLAGRAGVEHARARVDEQRAPFVIRVLGTVVDDAVPPADAAHAIATRWAEERLVVHIGERSVIEGARGALGASVDELDLAGLITRAREPRSLLRRYHAQLGRGASIDLPIAVTISSRAMFDALLAEREQVDAPAASARIDARTGLVTPERDGRRLDVHATLDRIEAALAQGEHEVEAVVTEQAPARTAAALAGVRIEALLGFFETRYSTLIESADRTFNLRVAASHIDGTVLMPGESFDFNAVVGERNEVNGFRPAPQIASGEVVDGVGGGTCQVSGTLHAAALFAGLAITERHPHSRPSAYLWMGLDAMVSYPSVNLVFQNDQPFPVVIGMTMEAGVLRAEIRGARAAHLVTFARRIDEVTRFSARDVPDSTLPSGVRVLRQRGVPGFHITRYRTVRDLEHNQARRERAEDTYPPTEEIWRVGSGPAAPADYVAPPGDAHGEYLADHYLSASEGLGTEDAMDIARTGGSTAVSGWTRALIAE
jgi:vancomycin resistance protein YoaR